MNSQFLKNQFNPDFYRTRIGVGSGIVDPVVNCAEVAPIRRQICVEDNLLISSPRSKIDTRFIQPIQQVINENAEPRLGPVERPEIDKSGKID